MTTGHRDEVFRHRCVRKNLDPHVVLERSVKIEVMCADQCVDIPLGPNVSHSRDQPMQHAVRTMYDHQTLLIFKKSECSRSEFGSGMLCAHSCEQSDYN